MKVAITLALQTIALGDVVAECGDARVAGEFGQTSEGCAAVAPARLRSVSKIAPDEDSARQEAEGWLGRMGAGEEAALALFYDRFSPPLFGLAVKMLKNEKEAEDVLQDAFLYIWRKAAAYNAQLSSPFSWAVMIVRHKAIDRIRSRQRIDRIVESATAESSHVADTDELSAREPVLREERAMVRSALARLPGEQRQALELAFFGGFTHEEIAERLGAPLGTIKARIRRGLVRLRDLVMEAR
ncbi:MAG: sigma-70 family RNA polymerase sigma factor [Terrimicrobiaceae bacterium]|nr:sigma-70 family RNA polymerase sigma factor [Terrimicrobiaceae bacterium]